MTRKLLCITILFSFIGCTAAISQNIRSKNIALRDFKKLNLSLKTVSGAISVTGTGVGTGAGGVVPIKNSVVAAGITSSIESKQRESGAEQAVFALQDLAFGLESLGFVLVENKDDADIIAIFSIGSIQRDPFAGWIADQAFLTFKDRTGKRLCAFKADTRLVIPTVSDIVRKFISAVERQY